RRRNSQLNEIVIKCAREQSLKASAHKDVRLEAARARLARKPQGMFRPTADDVVNVCSENDLLAGPRIFDLHFDGEEWRVVDSNVHLLDGRHQIGSPVGIAA